MLIKYSTMKLNIVIILMILLSSFSCRKVDYSYTCNYIYNNESKYNVIMKVYNINDSLIKRYDIPNNSSVNYQLIGEEGIVHPFDYEPMVNLKGDSVVILFDSLRIMKFYNNNGVLNKSNYNEVESKKHVFDLTYTFTNVDYDKADSIK